jgi:hypothetical protein
MTLKRTMKGKLLRFRFLRTFLFWMTLTTATSRLCTVSSRGCMVSSRGQWEALLERLTDQHNIQSQLRGVAVHAGLAVRMHAPFVWTHKV